MRASIRFAVLLLLGWSMPAGAGAQAASSPVSIEVGAGALVPLDDWKVSEREAGLRTSPGFLVSAALRVALAERWSVWAGFDHTLPGCDDCAAFSLDERMREHGFALGLGVELISFPSGAVRADLGGAVRRLGFEGQGERRSSDWGLGFDARLTGSWALAEALFLEPSVGLGGYPARYTFDDGVEREIEVRFLAPRVGLRYRF